MGFLGDEIRRVMEHDKGTRQARTAKRHAPREYERLTAVYRPLVEAALKQPNPTPALRRHAERIAREIGLL